MSDQKVFCLGFSKTGTTSLERALEILGYKVCRGHWDLKHNDYLLSLYVNKDFEEILKLTRYWNAFADAPWGGSDLYRTLYKYYPNSKYILTIRYPESWYTSFIKNFTQFNKDLDKAFDAHHASGRYGSVYYFKHLLEIDTLKDNRQRIIDFYIKHNKEVQEFFSNRDEPLLVLDITQGKDEYWERLCSFLNKPIPEVPFPHINKSISIQTDNNEEGENLKLRLKKRVRAKIRLILNAVLDEVHRK